MYSERKESCGKRISQALSDKGMSQSELCKRAKVPKSSLSLYISGAYEPRQDRIYAMATVLEVDPAWLMGYDVPKNKEKENSPDKITLTEGEKKWLELYHQISDESKVILTNMVGAFDRLPTDKQKFLLDAVRIALGNQK